MQQETAIGVGIGAHAALAFRSQLGKFGAQLARLVEQLFAADSSSSTFPESSHARIDLMSPIGT